MGLFDPRYLKEARELLEGASKVLHQHRDLLSSAQLDAAQSSVAALKGAIATRNRQAVEKSVTNLELHFSGMIRPRAHSLLAENVEAILVAVVLAVGFQAYFLKPFKIPTGSMQPTLFGMTGNPTSEVTPPPQQRALDFIRLGRTHLDLRASQREEILGLKERTVLNFFTFTEVVTSAGRHTLFAPSDVVARDFGVKPGRLYEQGETIVHGYVQAGDQVFVDRMTYQFASPSSGDVFVFKTTGIRRIEMNLDPALGSQFYIKRLAGVTGSTLSIAAPDLYLDGSIAANTPFQRVMSCRDGYRGYSNPGFPAQYLTTPTERFTVPPHSYFALGDNSYNSSDSRYWGIVPEKNVIGRGFVVYWPFSSRWGFIR